MIVLETTDTLQVFLSSAVAANEAQFIASWADDGDTPSISRTLGDTNGTTPVTLTPGPSATEKRIVREIQIYNKDNANVEIVVQVDDGSVTRVIHKETVVPGNSAIYDGGKWVSAASVTPSGIGALAVAANLSDVASVATSRVNLGFDDPILDKGSPGEIGADTPAVINGTMLATSSNIVCGGDILAGATNSSIALYGGTAFNDGPGIVCYGKDLGTGDANTVAFYTDGFTNRMQLGTSILDLAVDLNLNGRDIDLGGGVVYLGTFTVATAPSASNGHTAYFTNARKSGEGVGAGTGVLAVYTNGSWSNVEDYSAIVA